jgi:hypothetical protein
MTCPPSVDELERHRGLGRETPKLPCHPVCRSRSAVPPGARPDDAASSTRRAAARWMAPVRSGRGAMRKTAAGQPTTRPNRRRQDGTDGTETSPRAALRRGPQGSRQGTHPGPRDDDGVGAELRAEGEVPIRKADGLACESWNEKMWADGGPIDPSPTVDQSGERRLCMRPARSPRRRRRGRR